MDRYKKGYIIGIIILVGAFVGMFIFDKRSMLFASVRNAAAVGAIIVVIYIIRMINTDYSLLRSISSISPELYFYHMPIALLLSYILNDSYVYMTVVIIISFLVAIVIHPVNNKIQIIIKRGIN
jgi:peptidoglycan/LPS O-acetylase OafA/YrhL